MKGLMLAENFVPHFFTEAKKLLLQIYEADTTIDI
jgi:hypothetical protein